MKTTHLLLISDQVLPNLIPLLDPETKPDSTIMLASDKMLDKAKALESIVKERQITNEIIEVENAYDISVIQNTILEILSEREDDNIILNATGGTKPMSIAAYEAFRAEEKQIYYIHPEQNQQIWLNGKTQSTHPFKNKIKLEHFLSAHGAKPTLPLDSNAPNKDYLEVAKKLVSDVESYSQGVSKLNYCVNHNHDKIQEDAKKNSSFLDVVDLFESVGLLKQKDQELCFDDAKRKIIGGGWFELWMFDQIRQAKDGIADIQDYAYNIEVKRNKNTQNELDAAILFKNRLHIIECKTSSFKNQQSKANDATYKLDSLKSLMGGLYAKAMLASFIPVSDTEITRAKDIGITIVSGERLKHIQENLKKFLGA